MKCRNSKGFTLLEVMIGLIIFSIGLLLLSSMLVVSIRGNSWSDKTTQSVQLMQAKVEDFRHAKTVDMVNGSDVVKNFHRSWTFEDLTTNLKSVSVVIAWKDLHNRDQACSTLTYLELK